MMTKSLETLQPSKETLALVLKQRNGSKWLYWLPWRFISSRSEVAELLGSCLEDALLGVYYTASGQSTWPRTAVESNQYWFDLEKLEQLIGEFPPFVKKVLPPLILGHSDEIMLIEAIQERLPRLHYGGNHPEIARMLISDLKSVLASGETSLCIDDGGVWMVNGHLAIVMVEVHLEMMRSSQVEVE